MDAVITAITGALSGFSVDALSDVWTAALTFSVPLIIAWFGFRFIWGRAKRALKKGS